MRYTYILAPMADMLRVLLGAFCRNKLADVGVPYMVRLANVQCSAPDCIWHLPFSPGEIARHIYISAFARYPRVNHIYWLRLKKIYAGTYKCAGRETL